MRTWTKGVAMALASSLGLACSVVGIRTTKEPGFAVVTRDGSREIRAYESFLVARTEVRGDLEETGSEGFRRLFRYISGHNTGAREIAMTAPVRQEKSGETWTMDFVMPAHFTRETVPEPLDERVSIAEVPARTVAVLRFSGRVDEEKLERRSLELAEWLAQQPYRAISSPVSARYDPPFALPFLRRNEIQIDVEPVE